MEKIIRTAVFALAAILIILAAVIAVPGLSSAFSSEPTAATPKGTIIVYFFYGEECPHCHEVKPLVESLQKKYPDVDFQILEIWHNQMNYNLFVTQNSRLGISQAGVPEVIVGDTVLSGSLEISAKLEQAILDQKKT